MKWNVCKEPFDEKTVIKVAFRHRSKVSLEHRLNLQDNMMTLVKQLTFKISTIGGVISNLLIMVTLVRNVL